MRATLDRCRVGGGASRSISQASRATLGEVKQLQGLCRAITGEDAGRVGGLKREKRGNARQAPASSFAG